MESPSQSSGGSDLSWFFGFTSFLKTLSTIAAFCSSFKASQHALVVCPNESMRMVERKVMIVRIIVVNQGCSPWEQFERLSVNMCYVEMNCKSRSYVMKPRCPVFGRTRTLNDQTETKECSYHYHYAKCMLNAITHDPRPRPSSLLVLYIESWIKP